MWLLAFASALCFDFSRADWKPLAEPLASTGSGPVSARGTSKEPNFEWGAARGLSPKAPSEILDWLLDHRNWKDPKKTEMVVQEEAREGLAAFHRVSSEVRVFAFITVSWTEEWAYRVMAGTRASPRQFQVAYQKTDGTGHIRSLCGFIDGKDVAGSGTDLSFYEQSDASHYSAEDIEKMHLDNLAKLGVKIPRP